MAESRAGGLNAHHWPSTPKLGIRNCSFVIYDSRHHIVEGVNLGRRAYITLGRTSKLGNIRAINAFGNEHAIEAEGEGADIPDIPPRKSRRARGLSVVDYITSPPFKQLRKPKSTDDVNNGRDMKQDSTAPLPPPLPPPLPQRPTSPQPIIHEEIMGRAHRHEPEHTHDSMASSSPSVSPRSIMSKSSQSHLGSPPSSTYGDGQTTLPALQTRAIIENDGLEPLAEEEIDPASFDLVVPVHAPGKQYSLEIQSELLFSAKHLKEIFDDPVLLQRFTNYIYHLRPASIPILQYYLDTIKALKAIDYANAIVKNLQAVEDLPDTSGSIDRTTNKGLREKADKAFETIANEDLPAYITHSYIQTVSVTIKRRIADTLPSNLREMSEGLAEVFCLTDPARKDNPIIFASEGE
ncbi:hypothetical protein O1611_g1577 [Lasiodiplodia mahajangana]|uniref:Uncharacterized protein n=1 Tax=Lasiodiplodia mahajangana TaxID=1108764 RepID=A0ACC2JX68_9PEZI|nr:hypothetical protein O1611_g1577 [Lasiodiplodia mahajangana]